MNVAIDTSFEPGIRIVIGPGRAHRLTSGWVGVYRNTSEERRLFCILLPGDTLIGLPGCVTEAINRSRSEYCLESEYSLEPLIKQAFRLSQYDAHDRVADFLFDAYCRLKKGGHVTGLRYPLPITQVQIAELLGLSAVHINRTMKKIAPMIRVENHQVYIENLEKLTELFGDGHSDRQNTVRVSESCPSLPSTR